MTISSLKSQGNPMSQRRASSRLCLKRAVLGVEGKRSLMKKMEVRNILTLANKAAQMTQMEATLIISRRTGRAIMTSRIHLEMIDALWIESMGDLTRESQQELCILKTQYYKIQQFNRSGIFSIAGFWFFVVLSCSWE